MVPLMQNGVLQGLLVFGAKVSGKVLHRDEIAFLEHAKVAGAIALSNASLYEDLNELKEHLEGLVADRTAKLQRRTDQMTFELRLASAVQKSILPPAVQEPPGLRLAARMIPMMEVSGDFYYARPLSDRRYGVAIIDVSGHGMPAALLTSMIKTEIDRQFVDGRSTAEICSALGEELAPALAETGLYFTAFVGIIDRDSRLFHYTGCGHVAPVIVRGSKGFHILESCGVVLGSALIGVYQSQSTELHPGDRLFLFTDGLMDASDESGEVFGEERLYALMQSGARKPAGEQLEEILVSVSGYRSNGSRSDDMTLMSVDVE
jgi:sigma-B regulation protein RsbU (phosphoserine phosphatase)